MDKVLKSQRVLELSDKLKKGEIINKSHEAEKYGVSLKTIQRDLSTLRNHLENHSEICHHLNYHKKSKGFTINKKTSLDFDHKDIYALCKIILESRAFTKAEMERILGILLSFCNHRDSLEKMLSNDRFNYTPPRHNTDIVDFIWKVNSSIRENREVKVKYRRQDNKVKEYSIRPLGLVFNEYYFYLIGEVVGKPMGTSIVFRLDRFIKYDITSKRFLPYEGRLKEGEFNKRIQFMYTGDLINIQFKFWGDSLEAVLDRLPTAKVIRTYIENDTQVSLISAEVYGEGIKRWLLSQKEFVEVVRPESYRNSIKETIRKMYDLYQ